MFAKFAPLHAGAKRREVAATYLGAWILLLVVGVYGPIFIMADPSTAAKIEGFNCLADALLFGATILSLVDARKKPTHKCGRLKGKPHTPLLLAD